MTKIPKIAHKMAFPKYITVPKIAFLGHCLIDCGFNAAIRIGNGQSTKEKIVGQGAVQVPKRSEWSTPGGLRAACLFDGQREKSLVSTAAATVAKGTHKYE